jgi:hypothetical protein
MYLARLSRRVRAVTRKLGHSPAETVRRHYAGVGTARNTERVLGHSSIGTTHRQYHQATRKEITRRFAKTIAMIGKETAMTDSKELKTPELHPHQLRLALLNEKLGHTFTEEDAKKAMRRRKTNLAISTRAAEAAKGAKDMAKDDDVI